MYVYTWRTTIFWYIYSVSNVSNVVILEGRENMFPLFDSVLIFSADKERKKIYSRHCWMSWRTCSDHTLGVSDCFLQVLGQSIRVNCGVSVLYIETNVVCGLYLLVYEPSATNWTSIAEPGRHLGGVGVGRGIERSVFFAVRQRMERRDFRPLSLPRHSRTQVCRWGVFFFLSNQSNLAVCDLF